MDNTPQQNDDDMMRYVDNQMDATERAAFEQQLKTEVPLKAEVDDLQAARKAVIIAGAKEEVRSVREAMSYETAIAPVIPMKSRRRWVYYAVGTAAALFLGFWFFVRETKADPDKLYAQTYLPFTLVAERGASTDSDKMVQAYMAKDYAGTRSLYGAIPRPTAKQQLLAGVSDLETGNPMEAAGILESMHNGKDSAFHDEGMYYLALAYLKDNDFDKAAATMQEIHDDAKNSYSKSFSSSFIEKVKELGERD